MARERNWVKKTTRNVFFVVLIAISMQSLAGCVSQPMYSDYMNMPQEAALDQLNRKKKTNTIKIVINWLTAGYGTFWLASIVDTIRLISFSSDFSRVESQIRGAAPPGALAGTTQTAASNTPPARTSGVPTSLPDAISRVCDNLLYDIPRNSTVAILEISSRNREAAAFALEELEYLLVESKQLTMVDRNRIDIIRREQNFQMSGDVSDDSAVSIGNMLGANVVITGTITGSDNSQRLTVKALDVKTAQIITIAREQL